MKAESSTANHRNASHPPLAHDSQGLMIPVPDGTTHWRILRHTGGRPKPIPGPDMQPARFGLDMTHEDLLEMCGPGTYRIEALDQYGNRIDLVTTVAVAPEAQTAAEPTDQLPSLSGQRAYASSDLRVAMEAIAHMSRTHTESLRALAMAQADWIKMLASQKALPRNGYVLPPAVPPEEPIRHSSIDDDDDDGDDNEDKKPSWVSAIEPLVPMVVGSLVGGSKLRNLSGIKLSEMLDWRMAADAAKPANAPATDEVCATAHIFRVRARLTPTEQRFLDELMNDDAADQIVALLVKRNEDDAAAFLRDQFASLSTRTAKPPQTLAAQIAAVTELLTPEEKALVMSILPGLPPEQVQALQAQLVTMSPTEAVTVIRNFLAPKKAAS